MGFSAIQTACVVRPPCLWVREAEKGPLSVRADTEKRRAGLEEELRFWTILDEYNGDIVGRSFHFEPERPRRSFSKAFFLQGMRAFIARRKGTRSVEGR